MEKDHTKRNSRSPDGSERRKSRGLFTIQGIVVPVDWDEAGHVTSIAILTADEDEYFVQWDEKGKQLLSFIQEEIEASGVLESCDNKKILRVKRFRKGGGKKPEFHFPARDG